MEVFMRSLSGIQPSGILHIGNYFGAIKQFVELQDEYEGFYFLANYHALTSSPKGEDLKANTIGVILDYLALGLNPEKSTLFLQSDVPEHAELSWILSNIAPMGLLERAHSYKDKVAKGIKPNVGLFTYPILMAADILMYSPDIVPVGKDQKQHLEMTRDIATKFNETYGKEVFKLPKEKIVENVATVPGTDGDKMSKSYGNVINMFGSKKALKKQIMSIVTDSTPLEEPKDPDNNITKLYALFATETEVEALKENSELETLDMDTLKMNCLTNLWIIFHHFRKKEKSWKIIWTMYTKFCEKVQIRLEALQLRRWMKLEM